MITKPSGRFNQAKSFEEKLPDIARDIVNNTYNLDENTLNHFRGFFEDKFGCKPEGFASF